MLTLWLMAAPATASGDTRPNIVVFFMDDVGYSDLRIEGAFDVRTPHLDRLARVRSAHQPAPRSCPGRGGDIGLYDLSSFDERHIDSQSRRKRSVNDSSLIWGGCRRFRALLWWRGRSRTMEESRRCKTGDDHEAPESVGYRDRHGRR